MRSWMSCVVLLKHLSFIERRRMRFLLSLLIIEPIALYWGFGFGLGNMISGAGGRSYAEFLFPGFISFAAAAFSFAEAAWGINRRWRSSILLKQLKYSPISPADVVFAEMIWCGLYGFLAAFSIAVLGCLLNFYSFFHLPILSAFILVFGLIGSTMGLTLVVFFKRGSLFTLLTSLLVFPLAFVSGIFFPISQVPWSVRWIGPLFPPFHTTQLAQALVWNEWSLWSIVQVSYLGAVGFLFVKFVLPRAEALVRESSLRTS